MSRKLASIQTITSLKPIEGADSIEVAQILGWHVVVKKGDFQVNDQVVYCEIDSIMPDRPEFEFLKPRGMRVRTIRLKGQISQGICFPLSILPPDFEPVEDTDCTDVLEVLKYEVPIPANLRGTIKGNFPSFIPKTDETRIQVLQPLLDKYKDTYCYITEKLDGSSATFYIKDGEFGVCSRNIDLLEDADNTFWKVARALDIENKLRSLNKILLVDDKICMGKSINKIKHKLLRLGKSVKTACLYVESDVFPDFFVEVLDKQYKMWYEHTLTETPLAFKLTTKE